MDFEEDLTRMLAESVEELDPPVAVMVAAGSRTGRRRRRLRRGLRTVGAAAVAAGVVAVCATLGVGRGGPRVVPAASAPASVSASAVPSAGASAATSASPSIDPALLRDITWQGLLGIFHDQLPPGAQLAKLDPYAVKFRNSATSRYIELQYDDGAGASTVMVELSKFAPGYTPPAIDCTGWHGGTDEGPRKPDYDKPACQAAQLPDGSRMVGYITATDVVGLYDDAVKLVRPDGTYLSITAANATLDQYTGQHGPAITVTRDKPPLGLAGWEAIAQSPQWQFRVPQSVLDAGAAFATGVSHLPCPQGSKPGDCDI
ncbi:hypothetical protein ACIGXM_02465 [Kitasatospora sp. NPDC052896]|uniref:hypothetical protein n=1 Tax=Kitasatospora sp. NPDC052896 TaxID=3364061 RepID=UPI0037C7A65F